MIASHCHIVPSARRRRFKDRWSATFTWGGRIAGRVADARWAHREAGRPDCWRDREHLRKRLAGQIYADRKCVGRGQIG